MGPSRTLRWGPLHGGELRVSEVRSRLAQWLLRGGACVPRRLCCPGSDLSCQAKAYEPRRGEVLVTGRQGHEVLVKKQ